MQLQLKDNLPFITLVIGYQGKKVEISDVLVDTGSASNILAADSLIQVGIEPSPEDTLHTNRDVGGKELRKVDFLEAGENKILDFEIEVGGMDYGFELNGIVGMDFLKAAKAIIDFHG